MKSEFLYLKDFESIEHFKQEFENISIIIITKELRQLKGMSPVQYRTHA